MKTVVATAALLLGAAGLASAQDERERKMDDLRREFERSMKGLTQKFEQERERLEKEFRAARERLLEKKGERRGEDPKPRSTEDLLERVLERLDQLEKRLDQELPRFDFKKSPFENLPRWKDLPRDFDFRDFKQFAPYWREFLPRWKDEDFRFEWKKKGEDDERKEEKKEKKDKKKDDEKKKF
jgi:hypothetical protein